MAWIRKDHIWPVAIVSVLAANVVLGAVLIRVAGNDQHFAVEPDYYRKAVDWDATMAQADRNDALGWSLEPRLGPIRGGGLDTLRVTIRDAAGLPLLGAQVLLEAMPVAYANAVLHETLGSAAVPGEYLSAMHFNHLGLWELRFTIQQDGDVFTAVRRMELSAGASAAIVTARPGDARP